VEIPAGMGGKVMKKNYKTYAFLILLIIAILAIMDGLNNSNAAKELRKEKDRLAEEAASFKKEYEIKASMLDEERKENKDLEESLSELEKEIESLRSTVKYKEFAAAVREVDTYKAVQTFEGANRFIALKDGAGSYTNDSEGNCPCGFFFEKGFEWVPNAVLDLKGFRIENDKTFLTYHTAEDIKQDYQFVMVMAPGRFDREEKWRINEIKQVEKGDQ
jgi:TolA-binding protein